MNKIIGATAVTVTVAGLLIWSYLEYADTEYICDKCGYTTWVSYYVIDKWRKK